MIALCDKTGGVGDPGTVRQLTFGGRAGLTLPPGETVISDETAFDVPAGAHVCVSLYIEKGKLRSGNCLNNAQLLWTSGDLCDSPAVRCRKRPRDYIIALAGKILGMDLHSPIPLFQAVELRNTDGASSIQCFGDSLMQQGAWTNPFEARIRSLYPGRYSVINKAIGGNRILRDTTRFFPLPGFFGTKALDRVHDDLFAFEGIGHVVFCMGTNDYLQPGTIAGRRSEYASAEEIAAGAERLAAMIRAQGLPIIGLNFVPTGRSADATPEKNRLRVQLNDWFDRRALFDHSFDISTPFADPDHPDLPLASYVCKDNTHPNAAGGRAIAGGIDCGVFGGP